MRPTLGIMAVLCGLAFSYVQLTASAAPGGRHSLIPCDLCDELYAACTTGCETHPDPVACWAQCDAEYDNCLATCE